MEVLGLDLFCLPVACYAQVAILRCEKTLVLSGMGKMAGETSLVADHRGVVKSHLFPFFRMALGAEGIPLSEKQDWIF